MMRRILNLTQIALLGGVMVFLQTSCSKEKPQSSMDNALKGPAPSGLARTHTDVTTFKSAYESWAAEESYSYQNLNVDDAEWVLEACFNFQHRFYDDGSERAVVINYEELDTYPVQISGTTITPVDLFEAYDHLLTITAGFEDIMAMSDIEIEVGDPDFIIHTHLSRLDRYRNPFGQRRAYDESHYAVGPVSNGPMGPRSYCGYGPYHLDPDYYAPALLTHNLGLTYDPMLMNGYHTDVYINTYGVDAFDDNPYQGFYDPSKDYELSLWGIHPSVNPASTATGEADECLTPSELSDYENYIKNLMTEQTPPGLRKHNVKLDPLQAWHQLAPNGWWHHRLTFTWSKFTEL